MSATRELLRVLEVLGDLRNEVVFVGGQVGPLLVTDSAAAPARPTVDVDCIIDVGSYSEYGEFSGRLRALGFEECTDEGAPMCRWVVDDVRVDVMPIDPVVFGFSNVWYPSGVEHAAHLHLQSATIRIVDAVHFCATKIEAYLARGDGDLYHHDLEDFLNLVDGRGELQGEAEAAPPDVRVFIAATVARWLEDDGFVESLSGHLRGDAASQARLPILLKRLQRLAALAPARISGVPRHRPGARSMQTPAPVHFLPRTPPLVATLDSSNLRHAAYDADKSILTIEFGGGRRYAYSRVPRQVYEGLLSAASHGRYFHQWIKDRYPYRRLR